MKFSSIQWVWIVASLSYIIAMILKVSGRLPVPYILLVCAGLLLMMAGRAIGPSMAESKSVNRRG